MATPHIAGVMALYLSREISLTPAQLKEKLIGDSTKVIKDSTRVILSFFVRTF